VLMSGPMENIFSLRHRKYRRVYLDLPGMGQSTAAPSVRTSDDMLEIILCFIDRVLPGEKFILAGESYGGYLSRALVVKREADILGLCLLCPAMIPGYRKGRVAEQVVLERDGPFLASLPSRDRDAFTYMSIVQTRPQWELFRKEVYPAVLAQNTEFLGHTLDGAFTYDIFRDRKIFERPALIVLGKQDTEVGFRDQLDEFCDYPRATMCVLDKAGHNLQIEQKRLFQGLFRDLLDRVESFGKVN